MTPPRTQRKVEQRKKWYRRITRDVVMFGAGLLSYAHEVLASPKERPYIIAASLGLMGAPFALYFDQMRRSKNGNGNK